MEKSRRKQKKSRGSCSACIDRDNALYYLLNIIYRHFHVNLPWELRFHCRPIETFPPRSILLFILFVFLLMFLINCAAAISQFQQTSSLLGLYIYFIYMYLNSMNTKAVMRKRTTVFELQVSRHLTPSKLIYFILRIFS